MARADGIDPQCTIVVVSPMPVPAQHGIRYHLGCQIIVKRDHDQTRVRAVALAGGVVWDLIQTPLEETVYDHRLNRVVNASSR
jgi:hypothetical protein